MRVDEKVQEKSSFNVMLIIFFFIGSSNILSLIFMRTNPIMYGNNIQDTITKYELCEEQYGIVSPNTWQNMNRETEKLLTTSYIQQEALKIFSISDKQGEDYIKKNRKFFKNGVYNHNLFKEYLQNIQKVSKTRITEQDYLNYIKIHLAALYFKKMRQMGMRGVSIGDVVKKSVNPSLQLVQLCGYKVTVNLQDQKSINQDQKITKQEIKEFIKRQRRNKIRFYLDVENISGFLLIVKIGITSTNVIEAVNFFLKQEAFDKNDLISFMTAVAIESDNFDNIVDYQKVINKWKKNGKKPEKIVDISLYFTLEELHKVEENDRNLDIFNSKHPIHKSFIIRDSTYCRFITQEHNKEKAKVLTDDDMENYVLPAIRLTKQKEALVKQAYNLTYKHNDNTITLSKTNKLIKIDSILYKFDENIKGKAIVIFDNTGYPYILVVEDLVIKDMDHYPISVVDNLQKRTGEKFDSLFNLFADYDLYKNLFFIYYDKVKNEYKA